jgi:signal transduction histidine kinase/DNA-binding response OmpR family regulator
MRCFDNHHEVVNIYYFHTYVKKPISFFALLLICFCANAQNTDSLRQLLKVVRPDTVKVNLFLKLSDAFAPANKDSALHYVDEAITLSEKLDYAEGLMKANFEKGAITEYSDRKKSLGYFLVALSYARQLQQARFERSILSYAGMQSYMLGDYMAAEDHYLKSLVIGKNENDFNHVTRTYTNLGMTYTKLTDYARAFDMLTLSNQLADSLGLKTIVGGNYIDIGNILVLQKKYPEALLYYEKAATVFKSQGNQDMLEYTNIGIGETYMQMGKYEKAIDFFNSIEKYTTDKHKIFDLYQNLGISFLAIEKYKEAEKNLIKAQQINDRITQTPSYSVRNYIGLAQLCLRTKKLQLGLDYAHRAEMMARQQGALSYSKECYEVLSSLYEANGELGRSLAYQRQFAAMQDSIARKEESRKLAEAETKFRLSEKTRELNLLNKENELQKNRERLNRTVMIAMTVVLLIIVLASFLLAWAYRKSKSKNELLATQKAEIEKASALIVDQSFRLLEMDKMKSRFFANISHELRTPVTLISGMLELMVEGNQSLKDKERAKIALGNSRKLNAIVEEMLDLTRLEANKVVLKKNDLLVQPLLDRIVNTFDSLLEKNQIKLTTDMSTLPLYASLDENYFEKIINNLVYNAIKFTPPGGLIKVSCRLSDDKSKIEIQVGDTGSGISEDDLPHIFERFYQSGSGAQKHDVRGTGIGLSLVKEFTELHGGEVFVASTIGKGSVFSLSFPVVTPLNRQPETETGPIVLSYTKFAKPPVVLLVEDHEEMRSYVSDILGDRFTIAQAANGVEALKWLHTNVADLIVSDVMMPQMDGYTFLSHLKANEKLKRVPVILLTARAAEEDKLQGLCLGVDDYLVKPFNATELKIRVENLLQNSAARREWLQKAEEPEEKLPLVNLEEQAFMAIVVSYVEQHISDRHIETTQLADHLSISERQLYRKSHELTGMAPAQLIKEVRLKKAWQLLVDKKVSKLSVLASEVGYESASYFAKQFEARFGKRPSDMM